VEELLTEGPLVKAAAEATRERTATVFMVDNIFSFEIFILGME
jgi:hypothetical protein